MTPYQLIGKGYRLGSRFDLHGTGDCLSLARAVLAFYGVNTPEPRREWYKRLRRGDTEVFREELERWGQKATDLDCGVVALCRAENGYGMAAWFEGGWISFVGSEVRWSPIDALQVVALYCPRKRISATPLG